MSFAPRASFPKGKVIYLVFTVDLLSSIYSLFNTPSTFLLPDAVIPEILVLKIMSRPESPPLRTPSTRFTSYDYMSRFIVPQARKLAFAVLQSDGSRYFRLDIGHSPALLRRSLKNLMTLRLFSASSFYSDGDGTTDFFSTLLHPALPLPRTTTHVQKFHF